MNRHKNYFLVYLRYSRSLQVAITNSVFAHTFLRHLTCLRKHDLSSWDSSLIELYLEKFEKTISTFFFSFLSFLRCCSYFLGSQYLPYLRSNLVLSLCFFRISFKFLCLYFLQYVALFTLFVGAMSVV